MFVRHRALIVLAGPAAALLLTLGAAGSAHAQPSPQKRAEALNKEGHDLLFTDPAAAAGKFRQAIILSPEGRFYYNLCVALSTTGDLGNALMACDAVEGNGATPELKAKTQQVIAKIKEQIKKGGQNPDEVEAIGKQPQNNPPNNNPPNDPNNPNNNPNNPNNNPNNNPPNDPNNPNNNPNNPPPNNPPIANDPNLDKFRGAPALTVSAPKHEYTYTAGAALEFGGANVGDSGTYAKAMGGIRLFGDLLFAPDMKVGGEGYLDFMTIPKDDSSADSLSMFDLGAGIYKHFCAGHICVTPLAGLHVVGYAPGMSSASSDYASVGVRGQVQLAYAFGTRFEHVLGATIGGDFDLKPIGNDSAAAESFGLSRGGGLFMLSLGYTYRFNTPFGSSPFFQLE
jgi:hypothetical protein